MITGSDITRTRPEASAPVVSLTFLKPSFRISVMPTGELQVNVEAAEKPTTVVHVSLTNA